MKKFLKPKTVKWALDVLKQIPKDQAGLCYFLIFSVVSKVERGKNHEKSKFESEFYKFFGAPIKGDGVGCFNPFDGRWMAEDYINSTVYGRLLNGSHWWTDLRQGFFDRKPPTQFPAEIYLKPDAFETLNNRPTYPCLRRESLLPLTALATLYYRSAEIDVDDVGSLDSTVQQFQTEILSKNPKLGTLFSVGPSGPLSPYQTDKPSEDDLISVYPPCPYRGESQINIRLYADDVSSVKAQLGIGNAEFAEYFRKLIREKGIF